MEAQFMLAKLALILAQEKKLDGTTILELRMADRYAITSWIVNCGVKYGERPRPISLYKKP
jgi:hypothetical protein